MPRPPRPVFLAASSYRQKRIRDAARLLPVVGAILLLIPLLWTPSAEDGGVSSSGALLYAFGVWATLIFSAFLLSRILYSDKEAREEEEGDVP